MDRHELPTGAYFAYVVLSQYLAFGLTRTVWRALLRWATYLVETPEVKLTYRVPRRRRLGGLRGQGVVKCRERGELRRVRGALPR